MVGLHDNDQVGPTNIGFCDSAFRALACACRPDRQSGVASKEAFGCRASPLVSTADEENFRRF